MMEILACYWTWIWLEVFCLAVFTGVSKAHNQTGKLFAVATQSSTFVSNGVPWSADKAVDNCFQAGCIARTQAQSDNWIRLNLENVFKILSVVIHPVSPETCLTCRSTGLNGIHIEMSKIEGSQICVYTHNVSDENAPSIKIDAMDDGDPLPDSRYIIIRKTNSLMVAEIEVFGECADNYCGNKCTKFCFCRTPLSSTERIQELNCKDGCQDGWIGEKCNTSISYTLPGNCDPGRFGFGCSYWNHCRQDCHPWTGECLGPERRCKVGWSGPSCQKQKLEKPVYAGNELLIDDDVGSCVQTNTSLFVVLRELMNLSHIELLFKPDFDPTFKLIRPRKTLLKCWKQHDQLEFSDTLERASFLCDKTGVQILELRNLTGSICELELHVCATGTFGSDCDARCHCLDNLDCNSIDGNCNGNGICHAGWYDKACDKKCSNNTFGWSCQSRCHCTNNSQCHHVTGECPGGCEVGWEGLSCDKECSNNTFGWSCQSRCYCINNSQCHHVTGECPGGCEVGWEGLSCDKECSNNTFGWTCQSRCHCTNNSQCHHVTGECSGGCEVGWEGLSCDKECTNGTYGPGCNQTCHCVNEEPCNVLTGICSNGCSLGWKGNSCNIMVPECTNGTYGLGCNRTCHCVNEKPCNASTGVCSNGCSLGWQGDACDIMVTGCPDGLYGVNCDLICGHCSANQTCDHSTGHCSDGCDLGWMEPLCQRSCPVGYFGSNCSASCGHCTGNHSCHHETGECLFGCENNWTGLTCSNKDKEPKSLLESIILPGAAAGLVFVIIIVITIIVCQVHYREKKQIQVKRKNKVDGHEINYFVPELEPDNADDGAYGNHTEVMNEIKQTDYAEIQDVYEKLMENRSSINFENFQDVYKRLLSVQRDGKTILFHAYHSLKSADPVYSTLTDNISNCVNAGNMSYQELICQYQSLPRRGKGNLGQGSTHLLKLGGISYVVSDKSLSSTAFWEIFESHGVYTCIQIGETNIANNTRSRFGNVLIQCAELAANNSYTERKLTFQSPETDSRINITLLSSSLWEDYQEVPNDPAWVIKIIEHMEMDLKAKDVIMIHCRHSIDKAVMLSVMSGIYMKMKKTGLVDILGPTQAAWKLIPSCIGTYEQFKFLHDVALLAVKKYDKT